MIKPITDLEKFEETLLPLKIVAANNGAEFIDLPVLQNSDKMLDLYGENIRARAYMTNDPVSGEQFLRPDFTVPVLIQHLDAGAGPKIYGYHGKVWRKQYHAEEKDAEHYQIGVEYLGHKDQAETDSKLFVLMKDMLSGCETKVITGDIGIVFALIDSLEISEKRKTTLRRHVWHPSRFLQLLKCYSAQENSSLARIQLIDAVAQSSAENLLDKAGPLVGKRSAGEVHDRLRDLVADASEPALPMAQAIEFEALMKCKGGSRKVLTYLRGKQPIFQNLKTALDVFETRLNRLDINGVDTNNLEFDVGFGRSSMEYYDGFVFEFFTSLTDEQITIGTGGRYNTLTAIVSRGAVIPAVGAVLRPQIVHELLNGGNL